MLGVFAEFETNLRKERQLEGIAKAKAAGVYKGRKRKVPIDEVKQLKEAGRSVTEIAETFDVSRMAIYRALARWPQEAHTGQIPRAAMNLPPAHGD